MWSAAAAVVVLLSGAGVFRGIPRATAADTQVKMVEGSQSDYSTWKFAPEEITVPVGSTVVWHNDGKNPHTATAKDGSFDSAYLNPGENFQFKFSAPGDVKYVCKPHEALGMVGVIHVTGAAVPTTPATTATTQPASSATTATTAVGSPSTTTTAKAGSGSSTTTTATTAAGGSTTTTLAPALTPTSAPDSASSSTTTTTAGGSSEEGAPAAHKSSKNDKSSPVGIAFASVATLLLGAVSVRLLASKP
jgi:plastocyanin